MELDIGNDKGNDKGTDSGFEDNQLQMTEGEKGIFVQAKRGLLGIFD